MRSQERELGLDCKMTKLTSRTLGLCPLLRTWIVPGTSDFLICTGAPTALPYHSPVIRQVNQVNKRK